MKIHRHRQQEVDHAPNSFFLEMALRSRLGALAGECPVSTIGCSEAGEPATWPGKQIPVLLRASETHEPKTLEVYNSCAVVLRTWADGDAGGSLPYLEDSDT